MKTSEIFRFPLLVLSMMLVFVIFTSYGNRKVHPDLNTMMVDAFLKRNNKGDFSLKEFQKYTFFFENGKMLKGTAIVKGGLFSVGDMAAAGVLGDAAAVYEHNKKYLPGVDLYSEEGAAEMSPQQWIINGGYSADVPEVPASLRHFYDPTRNPGDRYLTDIANSKVMGTLQKYTLTNPHTDGIEWALGQPGDLSTDIQSHQYTWERGKLWMQMALKEPKQEKRNEFMAKAWRSLGETLHMIADNGCPPHVRNDAHPSPVLDNDTWFGDADPYEELVDIIRRDDEKTFTEFATGVPDATLKQQFRVFNSVREIAHALAVFTNKNFVTSQTISGTDKYGNEKKQITHPDNAYASPLLQNMTYNESDHSYYSSSGIKECTDREYFAKFIPRMCEPKVEMECVRSQAKVLIPNIIEAGANAIRLFIPKLSIEIKSGVKNGVKGEIKHETDKEYPIEIKYSGEVLLIIKDKNNREKKKITTRAKDGIFEEDGIKLAKDEKMIAKIEFGGVSIESPEFMGVNENIFGIYKGKYELTVSESTLLQKNLDNISKSANTEAREAGEYYARQSTKTEMESTKWFLGGGKGELSIMFIIHDAQKPAASFAPSTSRYFVRSGGNTIYLPNFLSQSTDPANGKCTGNYTNSGFDVQVELENLTYEIKATFSGAKLIGNWKCNYSGKQLVSGSFSTSKISDKDDIAY